MTSLCNLHNEQLCKWYLRWITIGCFRRGITSLSKSQIEIWKRPNFGLYLIYYNLVDINLEKLRLKEVHLCFNDNQHCCLVQQIDAEWWGSLLFSARLLTIAAYCRANARDHDRLWCLGGGVVLAAALVETENPEKWYVSKIPEKSLLAREKVARFDWRRFWKLK